MPNSQTKSCKSSALPQAMYLLNKVSEINNKNLSSQTDLIATIPLSLCEMVIIVWVLRSLVRTIRALRLHRNVLKYSLYRHFAILLVSSVIGK